MNRHSLTRLLSLILLCTSIHFATATKPNIIIILADDMGYSDPCYMGGEAETPNLDQLSEEGVTFLNCFNNAKCAPTRAALMTGLSCQRVKAFKSKGYIDTNEAVCMAEVFGRNGYATIHSGKWHIAPDPMEAGFQHQFGVNLAPYYFKPDEEKDGKLSPIKLDGENIDLEALSDDWFSTTAYTDYAMESIGKYALEENKPFFLYLAYTTPHFPLTAPGDVIDKYAGLFDDGTDAARQRRYDNMVRKGIVDPKTFKLPPYPKRKDGGDYTWESFSKKEQHLYSRKLEIIAAMIDTMDVEIGRLIQFLKDTGQYDNTLIVFLSDNGATTEKGDYGGLDLDALTDADINQLGTREGLHGGTSGTPVATVQNTPLSGGKTTLWDGGMRSSMIVHYPGNMSDEARRTYNRIPVAIFDIAPTCYDAANIEFPNSINGRVLRSMDGVSILPLLENKVIAERNISFMYKDQRTIRNESWKLFGTFKTRTMQPGKWQLFNMRNDQGEQTDLSKQHPEIVESMAAQWNGWDKDVGSIQGYHDYWNRKEEK